MNADPRAFGKKLYCILAGCFEDWDALAEHAKKSWEDVGNFVLALQAAAVAKAIDEFTASILHGDDKHQAWLKDKAAEYIRALRQEETKS